MSRPLRLHPRSIALALGLAGLGALGACLLPDEHADLHLLTSGDAATAGDVQADVPTPAGFATQKGRIIDLDSKQGVTGVTVDLGGKTGVSGDKGAYAIQVPVDTPFAMMLTGPDHIKLIEQEWKLSADFDRGTTSFVATSTSNTLRSALPGYDNTKANIGVGLTKVDPSLGGTCATEGGATITLELPGGGADAGDDAGASGPKLLYFQGGFPSKIVSTTQDGEVTPTAIFYNVPPGEGYKIHVTHPTCKVVDYPYTEGPITYTGGLRAEGGDAASFVRVFLK